MAHGVGRDIPVCTSARRAAQFVNVSIGRGRGGRLRAEDAGAPAATAASGTPFGFAQGKLGSRATSPTRAGQNAFTQSHQGTQTGQIRMPQRFVRQST